MANRTANYTAFYVDEPFNESNLGAYATKDFVYYNQLKAWKAADSSFPFVNAHDKTYNVRDGSDWESTLKPRLHERINASQNIILILSSITKSSRALKEEIEFGINSGLPIIVVYPEFSEKSEIAENSIIEDQIKKLWNNIPVFRDNMSKVATLHIPYKKEIISRALSCDGFKIQNAKKAGKYFY